MNFLKVGSFLTVLAALGIQQTLAQPWTSAYTSPTATGTCAGLPAALNTGFTITPVISKTLFPTTNPMRVNKMTFFMNTTSGKTDIYMTEKGGSATDQARVLYYNGTANTLTAIGTIRNVNYGGGGVDEQGVWGIALNPKTFAQDNFIYISYSTGAVQAQGSATVGWRYSRFKRDPTTKMIDTLSEKVLIFVPAGTSARWHTGGAMQFDGFGNLYITTADNEAEALGPGNTADLRGGTMRIHPDTTDPRGYTIPAGNFGEYWAAEFTKQNRTALAAKYRDTTKVKAQIYIKGSRNPYGMSVDKNRLGWVAWSECGPDAQRQEEYNISNHPGFGGWPFFSGTATRQTAKHGSYDEANDVTTAGWAAFNPTTNVSTALANNLAGLPGVDSLPPMLPPIMQEANGCAQGGAIIRYDGRINNPGMMPPHLDNTVIYGNFTQNTFGAAKFDTTTGVAVGTTAAVFTMTKTGRPTLNNPVDIQQGPDGALYVTDWGGGCCSGSPGNTNSGIVRVTYTGTCQDPGLYPGVTTAVSKAIRGDVNWLRVGGTSFSVLSNGLHEVQIMDAQGRMIQSINGKGWKDYSMPSSLNSNSVYFLQVKTEQGTAVRGFVAP